MISPITRQPFAKHLRAFGVSSQHRAYGPSSSRVPKRPGRRLFESEFARALSIADMVLIAPVYSAAHIKAEDVMSPQRVAAEAGHDGTEAHAMGSSEEIIDFVATRAGPGDRIVIMSNGSFDDIHRRLLERLNRESMTGVGDGETV